MQWRTILARVRAREEAKRKAFQVAETASVKDQLALLTERGSVEEVQAWLERCADVGAETAARVAPDLYKMLRDLSGETYRECEREGKSGLGGRDDEARAGHRDAAERRPGGEVPGEKPQG